MFRFYPDNVPELVWCARNLFEVNLIVRYVLASDGNFRTWLGQALQDEKEYIEGALAVAEQGSEQFQAQLRSRLAELDKLASRHELDFSKSFRVPSLAKDLGMEAEYTGLYKLFSKYVHLSVLLINGWYSQKPDVTWLDVFLVKAQIYAGDAVYRLSAACGLPSTDARLLPGNQPGSDQGYFFPCGTKLVNRFRQHLIDLRDYLISNRMGKRQPMRWSADGAHLLLQVRCAVLDDRLEKRSFGNGSLDSGQPVA